MHALARPIVRAARLAGVPGAAAIAAWALVGFAPLLAGPGYESALVAGLLAPGVVAARAAWLAVASPRRAWSPRVGDGALVGLSVALAMLMVALLHGLRAGLCSVVDGVVLFVLGPVAGATLAGVWGAVVGCLARPFGLRRPRLAAVLLGVAGPIGGVVVSLYRGFGSPIVFAFDPFAGYFSGTLYDTVIDGVDRLATYRLGSLCSALFVVGAAATLDARPRGRAHVIARWCGWRGALTAAALSGSLAITAMGDRLGHWQTGDSIKRQLGGERVGGLCTVVHPAGMREREVELFVRDCNQQLTAAAAFLGVRAPPRVTAFVFADAAQKRRLMGAADTYVAKPWRREVYVQAAGYPHPVLGHELAHVVAGELARGPLRIAGELGGLLPDPGLIEGIAVAASPDDDQLSPQGWSKVMLELGLLPPLRSIFSLGFLGHDAGRAYTVAGAFVGWVRDRWGADALGRWYGGASVEAVTGASWASLDASFREHLRGLEVPDAAMALGRSRFQRPGLFARRCPHEVDAGKREAQALLVGGDARGAARAVARALDLDRGDVGAKLIGATCAERVGDVARAERELAALAGDPSTPEASRNRAEERLGDLALARAAALATSPVVDAEARAALASEAAARFAALEARVLDEDHLRTLDVKLVAARDPEALVPIAAHLVGPPASGVDPIASAELLGRWAERRPDDGLPRYLLGRGALARGQPERAAALLSEALSTRLASPRVRREAARQLVFAGCQLRDRALVDRGLEAWGTIGAPRGNRDALLTSLAARCM